MCHPRPGTHLCPLRVPDHWSRDGDRRCTILLRSLCRTTRCSPTGRPCGGEEQRMKLSEIMSRNVEVMQPDDSLQSAAKRMRDRNIGFLPVCDGDTLIGVL